MEHKVKIHPNWLNKENEQKLMTRLHQIVSGDGNGPFQKEHGYRWQLDASNDWLAEIKEDELVICYRYGKPKGEAVANLCKELFS